MELITEYLLENPNFPIDNLDIETMYRLKIHNWNEENRSKQYKGFHKFFEVNNKIYRATLRFSMGENGERITLDFPVPFFIKELEIKSKNGNKVLSENKEFRSRSKKVSEYLGAGIERDLILLIHKDLMECLKEKEMA